MNLAQSRSDWLYAFTATVLGAYCGMRGCEIKRLQWKDINCVAGVLDIKIQQDSCWLAQTYAQHSLRGGARRASSKCRFDRCGRAEASPLSVAS